MLPLKELEKPQYKISAGIFAVASAVPTRLYYPASSIMGKAESARTKSFESHGEPRDRGIGLPNHSVSNL